MKAFHQFACCATLLASALGAQAAGSLLVGPANTAVSPGDSFVLQVRGSAFTDDVVGGGFNLSFDPAVLSLTSVSVDTVVWEFVSSNGQIDNVMGLLSDVYFNSFRAVLPTGDFNIATLQFTALAGGNSLVQMSASPSFPFADDLGEVIAVSFGGANVAVSAVPEPNTWALWLAGGAWVARRALGRKARPLML